VQCSAHAQVTANALRQQVMNREARRLEKEIKEVGIQRSSAHCHQPSAISTSLMCHISHQHISHQPSAHQHICHQPSAVTRQLSAISTSAHQHISTSAHH
jgi:hypothetical protein